jgi:protein-tyrosine phosphatase
VGASPPRPGLPDAEGEHTGGQPQRPGPPDAEGQDPGGQPQRPGLLDADGPGTSERPLRLLFVCLGNICRSPTAEGVMRTLAAREGLHERFELESAGTGAWHVGSPPDRRAAGAARARGIELAGSARQVRVDDFKYFDLLLAMDRQNARDLQALAPDPEGREKVRLLREFDPGTGGVRVNGDLDVPDPYYGASGGFEEVLDLVQAACEGLLAQVRAGQAP